jgi:lipopolysaccharide/colanic/teichoic acid biosynthesis glycosyltransferase
MVVIHAAASGARRHLHRLARLLCQRARTTDEIGWFDTRRLCVVLPDTSPDGAMYFIQQFASAAYSRALSPICHVLSYSGQMREQVVKLSVEEIARGMDTVGRDINLGEGAASMGGSVEEGADIVGHIGGGGKSRICMRDAGEVAALLVRPLPWWKRAVDLAAGSAALVLAAPLMAGIAVAIKLTDTGPVLFQQKRAGLGGRPFNIYKFRTMIVDADVKQAELRSISEQDGPAFKIKHDPRITRIGRLLRETSLDELPQLWNIVKGDMSIVGPRPLPVDESERCDIWHRRRLDVTPGLTCTWQVKGRSMVTFAEWIRMDRSYIRARSLWQDIKLMVMTVPSILKRRGR